ncbi:MAG: site-specific DNA-methyltransferase [Verrucomicrobiota bacterium]|jgi:DNA modification methylase
MKTVRKKKPRKPLSEEGKPGRYDPRNKINDLTGKDWLLLSRSFWFTERSVDDKPAYAHPAPFLVQDIEKLIKLFTKKGMMVLDPFAGSGTALVAANKLGRKAIGIDLNPEYRTLAEKRMTQAGLHDYIYFLGDANSAIDLIGEVDYIVTSPPYHNILKNNGNGLRHESGKLYRMAARNGVEHYGEIDGDLGNFQEYKDFLRALKAIMVKAFCKLRPERYCSIIISDFTVNKAEVSVQSDVLKLMQASGFQFAGTTVLLQPVKPLFPFGYPYAYKINHHHQNIMSFRKPRSGNGTIAHS